MPLIVEASVFVLARIWPESERFSSIYPPYDVFLVEFRQECNENINQVLTTEGLDKNRKPKKINKHNSVGVIPFSPKWQNKH